MVFCLHQTPSPKPPFLPLNSTHLRHRHNHNPNPSPPSPPLHLLRFRTDYHEKLHYLRNLNLLPSKPTPIAPSRESLDRIFTLIHFLNSQGISDSHIPSLAASCPQLFTSGLHPDDVSPVFHFLLSDLGASPEESAGLVLRCPHLLFSSVNHRLRPTLAFLRRFGMEKLNSPNKLNAHLLNMPVSKLVEKMEFLEGIGFSKAEAEAACGRMRALFGYSIGNCMQPKYEYLVGEMGRGVEEVVAFPQYFGFSLMKRIMPRHVHLKKRGVRVSLSSMLVCGDAKFYAKWK